MTKKTANHRHLLGAPVRDHMIDEVRAYVDAAAVAEVAGWITPVPGGVGPVTVAVLMRNAKTAHMRQKQIGWRA